MWLTDRLFVLMHVTFHEDLVVHEFRQLVFESYPEQEIIAIRFCVCVFFLFFFSFLNDLNT